MSLDKNTKREIPSILYKSENAFGDRTWLHETYLVAPAVIALEFKSKHVTASAKFEFLIIFLSRWYLLSEIALKRSGSENTRSWQVEEDVVLIQSL